MLHLAHEALETIKLLPARDSLRYAPYPILVARSARWRPPTIVAHKIRSRIRTILHRTHGAVLPTPAMCPLAYDVPHQEGAMNQ